MAVVWWFDFILVDHGTERTRQKLAVAAAAALVAWGDQLVAVGLAERSSAQLAKAARQFSREEKTPRTSLGSFVRGKEFRRLLRGCAVARLRGCAEHITD
jgi:hypothetical protein